MKKENKRGVAGKTINNRYPLNESILVVNVRPEMIIEIQNPPKTIIIDGRSTPKE
jgi:hypothetical protein